MATKILDLLLQLSVKGTGEAEQLQKAVEGLKASVNGFKGRSLDDILNGTKAKADLDLLVEKSRSFFDLIAKAGQQKLDFDLSKVKADLDIVLNKGKQFFDLIVTQGKTKVDLNLGQTSRDLDLVVAKGRQLFDLIATRGRQKIDFDLSKIEVEAKRAGDAIANLRNRELAALQRQQQAAAQAAADHSKSIAGLGREFLLFRRVLFGLGIIAAVREVGSLVQAFDKARQALGAVFGATNAAKEFDFIRVEAERLGLQVTGLADQYARFSAAARALGISQDLVKDNFLAVAEAGAKLALSSEDVEGALVAIQQIASKGRLSMEELRQQLGDRLPGAISIAAKGLGLTEARLFALVEAGQITSDMFLKTFPAALRASFGTDANTRIETTTATIQRFKNALSEMVDAAIRAGALDAFLGIVKDLTTLFRDPATAKWLSDVSKGIADVTRFARENIDAIKALIAAYLGFRLFSTLTAAIGGLGAALSKIGLVSGGVAPGLAAAAVSTKELSAAAVDGAPKVGNLAAAVGSLALAARSPIVIAVAGLAAIDAALIEALIAKLDRAREKSVALAEAQRQIGSQGRIATIIQDQIKALEDYGTTVALAKNEVASLSEEGLRFYKDSAEGAQKLAQLQSQSAGARIAQLQAELKAIELTNDKSDDAIRKIVDYRDKIAALQKQQATADTTAASFAASLSLVATRAAQQGITFDANIKRLIELGKSFETAAKSSATLSKISFDALEKDSQNLVLAFRRVVEEGKGVAKAFETLLPKDFAEGGIKAITDVGNALAFLQQNGELSAKVIGEQLAGALDKLQANDLQKFAVQAQGAFELGKLSAQGLAIVLDGQLRASLKNLGLDSDTAGKKISKAFGEVVSNFRNVAENVQATGDQIRGALDVAIQTAKTREELLLLKGTVDQLGLAAGAMADAVKDSLDRLDDRIRLSAGVLDSSLGDSFKRLGIDTKAHLNGIADQAKIDFDRILASGQATTLELETAFKKMAEDVTKANNGIPPINILIRAVDFNAFDLIVKAAETASVRTKKAINDAIPLAETKKQLVALSDAITLAFEKGKISADEFGQFVTEVGFKIRDAAAKPVGELAAAADLLSLKTRDQLKATSDNAREAFGIIASSGQFTNDQLAKGAQQFLDAYKAANDGVVDSFDPVVQKALEVVSSVNGVSEAISHMKDTALQPIQTSSNLRDMGIEALQRMLVDTAKAYRDIGIQNVQDLQIIQEIQKEINRRGAESAAEWEKTAKETTGASAAQAQQQRAAVPTAGGTPGGAVASTINFNFNGGALTVDDVKRRIQPVVATIGRRRQ